VRRILIVGSSCSGKTTLAGQLSRLLSIEHIELDALHWLPHWTERDQVEFHRIVSDTVHQDQWVVDGNYRSKLGNLVWNKADTIIWLDLPFVTVYSRVIMRSIKRICSQQQLWNGNTENLWDLLFRRDSLLYWVPSHWKSVKQGYNALFGQITESKDLLRFKSAGALEAWLANLQRSADPAIPNQASKY
jgi:adenylate kinase family enzyme